jgi:hypothetical protein
MRAGGYMHRTSSATMHMRQAKVTQLKSRKMGRKALSQEIVHKQGACQHSRFR